MTGSIDITLTGPDFLIGLNATLNTMQVILLTYIAARWGNGRR